MHRSYSDIMSRISGEPAWWQEGGIPRYGPFKPGVSTGVYCGEVALVEIACQHCRRPFIVAMETAFGNEREIAREIGDYSLCYGDPPNIDCCGAGRVDTSVTLQVIEYWTRHHPEYLKDGIVTDQDAYFAWRRDHSLEVEFPDPWDF
jgi:hypothetical protein